ncbi:MAG: HDIG domain-containing protein, partial [Oscillospiraceae bacterium]|nr:HDIG domain-containing protein [Candidatus Equicaccousia limihippi]
IPYKGNEVYCFAIIKDVNKKVSSKGGAYLDLNLSDATGVINAKLWDYNEATHGEFSAGEVVKVAGTLNDFAGSKQLRITNIRLAIESDCVDLADLVKASEYEPQKMFDELYSLASGFENQVLKTIVTALLDDKKEKLLYYPAAYRLHHAMHGGLLYHTLSVVRLCQSAAEIYPTVDKELLLSGAILHDIGKTDELEATATGTSTGYSVQGNLIGHLAGGAVLIALTAEKAGLSDAPETKLLMHMSISHHGVPEYGAAVYPAFLEAEILSQCDNLDATVYEFEAETENLDKDGFSGRVPFLDNRKVYNHARKEQKGTKLF